MNSNSSNNVNISNGEGVGGAVGGTAVGAGGGQIPRSSFGEKLRQKYMRNELSPPDLRVMLKKGKMIRLHKELFIVASPYFELLLKSEDVRTDGSYSVKLEINSVLFQFIRHFLYCGDVPEFITIPSHPPIPLDFKIKFELLAVSVNYEIDQLQKWIISNIKQTMKMEEAFKVLQMSRDLEVTVLEEFALGIIYENADSLLANSANLEDFCALGHYDVSRILSSDLLNCSELVVFHAALRWAEGIVKSRYTDADQQRVKTAVKYYFNQIATCIRFPLMSSTELAQATAWEDLLDCYDLVKVFQYISLPEQNRKDIHLKFDSRPRRFKNDQHLMPPPPESILLTPQRKRRLSDDNGTVVSFNGTPSSSVEKKVCFEVKDEKSNLSDEDDLFLGVKSYSGEFPSFEDASRRLLREKEERQIGTIKFIQIKFKQAYRPVIFPNCKDFILDAKYDMLEVDNDEDKGNNCKKRGSRKQVTAKSNKDNINLKAFLKNFDLMRYLVVQRKNVSEPLTAADIWTMNQNILLKFNGIIFLNVQHAQDQSNSLSTDELINPIGDMLVLNYIRESLAILGNSQLKPTTLAISNCEFSSSNAKCKERLRGIETMVLYRVWGDFTAEDIMKDYPNLKELVLWKHTPQTGIPQKGSFMSPLCMNFSNCFAARSNIRKLVLYRCELKFPTRCVNAATTVSELHLDRCYMSVNVGRGSHIEDVFHLYFPELERFQLVGDFNTTTFEGIVKPGLVNCVCNNIKKIKWFRIVGLDWKNVKASNCRDEENEGSSLSFEEIQKLQLSSFLRENKISPTSTNFLLQNHQSRWSGEDYEEAQNESYFIDGGYHSAMDVLEYEWYSLKHFYSSLEDFENHFIQDDHFPQSVLWI